ncbi:hypothetical protein D3C79_760190 [compost metagenome]
MLGEQFHTLWRTVGQLVVIAAQHRIQATNGLVGMQYVVWRVHPTLCPAAEVGHQVFIKTAVQGLTVGPHVGAWDAFEGDYQQVAGTAAWQLLAVQVGLGQAGTGQRCDRLRLPGPAQCLVLQRTDADGKELMGKVVLAPLIGVGRRQMLSAPVQTKQRQRYGQRLGAQRCVRRSAAAPGRARPNQQASAHDPRQPGMGKPAVGGVFHELCIEQVTQVGTGRQPAHCTDQLCRSDPQCSPRQQHGRGQPPGPAVQQQHQQAAQGKVRKIAKRVGPTQQGARSQGYHYYQGRKGYEPGMRMAVRVFHENFP